MGVDAVHDTAPPPREGAAAGRRCEGPSCGCRHDVRFDHVSKLWLCLRCWANVDPKEYGRPGR